MIITLLKIKMHFINPEALVTATPQVSWVVGLAPAAKSGPVALQNKTQKNPTDYRRVLYEGLFSEL